MTELSVDPAATLLQDLRAAATAAVDVLPAPYPLSVGVPGREAQSVSIPGVAVRARFTGSISGTVLIVIDSTLNQALANAPTGPLDVTAALRPVLEAAAMTIGPVALGAVDVCAVDEGLTQLMGAGGAVVALSSSQGVQAGVGLLLDPPLAPRFGPVGAVGAPAAASSNGLDLLRGVEMEVSAELGRARMSLDELLSLSDGAVIELDRAAGGPADLLVNGRLIARGEVVVVDENFGLRITEIISDAR